MTAVKISALSVLVALLPLGAATAAAQGAPEQARQRFRSSVDVVTIQASVRDRHGRPVKGLAADEFEVLDNGIARPIVSLQADARSPISVAILVDMSGSMAVGPKMALAHHAFDALVSQLRAGQDEVALFTFDAALHERLGFTRELNRLQGSLFDFGPFGNTSLYDATAEAARRLAARSAARKAIVVLTDGIDTSSSMTATEVSAIASSIDVPVYVIAAMAPLDEAALVRVGRREPRAESVDLRDLADWTGGQLVFASTLRDTASVAASLIDELRLQYVIAIEAGTGPEWRPLNVRVKRSAATVKARSGYFGG